MAAEVALSVLLYGGTGLVRSLTTVLAVEGLALAGGLWSTSIAGTELVDRLRRRWLLCLLAYTCAGAFGVAWSLVPELGAGRLGQGAGLALLGGLPLYGAGGVLGGMSMLASTDPGERLAPPGAAAAAGAALGFVVTGFFLPRVPVPASLIAICLVMLSLGGMIYGVVLAARTQIDVLARRPGRGPDVVVEEVRLPIDDLAIRRLREGDFVRRSDSLEGPGPIPWDVTTLKALVPEQGGADASWHVLIVGGGASSAPREVLASCPSAELLVVERTAAVVEVGREYFGTQLSVGQSGRCTVRVGNLDDAVAASDGGYDAIVVDSSALEPIGGAVGLSRIVRGRLPALLARGGVLVWGPDSSGLVLPDSITGWSLNSYRRTVGPPRDPVRETLALIRREADAAAVVPIGGFTEVPVG